jgi:hypothetical protein
MAGFLGHSNDLITLSLVLANNSTSFIYRPRLLFRMVDGKVFKRYMSAIPAWAETIISDI